ncbi:hypothetical protein HanRHA438_Chr06g0253301 [Helianthus annuus]|nr:hypothetical protein HanRHA438_Chr06g0253301 [Helianthus annuus]
MKPFYRKDKVINWYLKEIPADFSLYDGTTHSVFADKTLTDALKSPCSNLQIVT